MNKTGIIYGVNGPVIYLKGDPGFKTSEMVYVGKDNLVGEVIGLKKGMTTVQGFFEETTGNVRARLLPAPAMPSSVLLGPGIIHNIFDGIQRPLEEIAKSSGKYISRGGQRRLSRHPEEMVRPYDRKGGRYRPAWLDHCRNTGKLLLSFTNPWFLRMSRVELLSVLFRRLHDPGTNRNCPAGQRNNQRLALAQKWPIRIPRPTQFRYPASVPLITGQRILDTLFPIAKAALLLFRAVSVQERP